MRESSQARIDRICNKSKFYNSGQVRECYKFLKHPPNWLILGGPGDANEAQVINQDFSSCQIVSLEPCKEMFEFQKANSSPKWLLPYALSDRVGLIELISPAGKGAHSASAVRGVTGNPSFVLTVTADLLSEIYGPFENAILWLDIEGMEWPALQGCKQLLESRSIQLINLETSTEERPREIWLIDQLLTSNGFQLVHLWNWCNTRHDRIYILK